MFAFYWRGYVKPILRSNHAVKHVILSAILSWIILCFIFSDLLLKHDVSFVRFVDLELNFTAVTTVVMSFLHGGFPIWNPFDQMPLTYYYLVGGLFNYSNLMAAGLYLLLSRFYELDGHAYHGIYSVVFFIPASIVRTIGAYCLLKRFCRNSLVLLSGTVLCTTILSAAVYFGLNTSCFYSFFPIMMHFVLRYVEDLNLDDLLLAFLTFTACVVFDPWIGLGYFYLGLHFFTLAALFWLVIFNREKLKQRWRDLRQRGLGRTQIYKILGSLFIWFVVILPWAFIFTTIKTDFHVAQNNRMEQPFSISEYFSRTIFYAEQSEFFWRMLDFSNNNWAQSWLFLGFFTALLGCVGIFFYRDNRKFIFLLTIAFLVMLNSPREMTSVNGIVHWLNALTNPFKFLTRSMHMTSAFLLPYVLMPLVAMGAQSIMDLLERRPLPYRAVKSVLILVAMLLWITLIWRSLVPATQHFLIWGMSLATLILLAATFGRGRWVQSVTLAGCGLLFFTDIYVYRIYYRPVADATRVMAHNITGLEASNPVLVDYVNPKILPWTGTYQNRPVGQVEPYLQTNAIGMQGLVFRHTELSKYAEAPHIYHPRASAYKELSDPLLQSYLQRDTKLIRFVDYATPADPDVLSQILDARLDKRLIEVSSPSLPHVTRLLPHDKFNSIRPASDEPEFREGEIETVQYALSEGKKVIQKNEWEVFIWNLPPDFPDYVASSVFQDNGAELAVKVDGKPLQEVQGGIIRPFQFDVQNVATGKLALSLPPHFQGQSITLSYLKRGARPENNGVVGLVQHQMDRLEFDFKTPKSGWLVFHFPYDRKFQLTIDGVQQPFYKVNRAFMGTPIEAGKHRVLLEYWQGTWLRSLIAFSAVASVILILVIFAYELRRMNRQALRA